MKYTVETCPDCKRIIGAWIAAPEDSRQSDRLEGGLEIKTIDLSSGQVVVVDRHADDCPSTAKNIKPDGHYLFRESPNHYWRAAEIKGGKLYGKWIRDGGPIRILGCHTDGEWRGALDPFHPDILKAQKDSAGRLIDDEESAP